MRKVGLSIAPVRVQRRLKTIITNTSDPSMQSRVSSLTTSPTNKIRLIRASWYKFKGKVFMASITFSTLILIIKISLRNPKCSINIKLYYLIHSQTGKMSDDLCKFHCGTRIDVDEELLEEREMWKEKYLCLQKQVKVDIDCLKENIYAECAALMQKQFSSKEAQHNRLVNQKNVEIKDLISRVIHLQTELKVATKEKEILEQKVYGLEVENNDKDRNIDLLKSKLTKTSHEWELKHEEQIAGLRKRLHDDKKDDVEKIQLEKEHLKHKIREFQNKYQKMIPEIEKMKNALAMKSNQVEQLEDSIPKIHKDYGGRIEELKRELDGLQKINSKHTKHSSQLTSEIEALRGELEKCKKITKEVKVEPVYIDRPVQVEKIVEKVIEVEKVVKKYIDNPNSERTQKLEEENKRLVDELNNLISELKEMQAHFQSTVNEYEEGLKTHEENAIQYKKERELLAHRITEQNRQIDLLQEYITRSQKSIPKQEPEKVVVHVKQDGTFQKTVQKVPVQQQGKRKR